MKGILYARGVEASLIKKLNKKAKELGYKTLGSYLNELLKSVL